MKIAVIASLYTPYARGGAEIVAQTVIDELKKKHDVFVITLSPWKGWKSLCPTRTSEGGMPVYRFYSFNIFSYIDINKKPLFLRLFWHIFDLCNMQSAWNVCSILQKEKPDIVMTHTLKGLGYTIPFAIKKTHIPHVHTVHDVQFVVPNGQYLWGQETLLMKSFALQIYRMVTRFLLGSPQCVIFPSRFLNNFYDQYGFFQKSEKIILQNPIQECCLERSEGFHVFNLGIPLRHSADRNDRTFLYLGQLEKHKGILFLLDVFQKWKTSDVHLIIAGSGSCEKEVQDACIHDARISFLGYTTGSAREQLFSRVHCVVVPSLCYENAPLVIGEALCRGIPVIAAQIGGAHELIQQEKNGWTFTPADTQSLLRVFSLAHTALCTHFEDLSLNAKKTVQGFTSESYCNTLLEHVSQYRISPSRNSP